MYLLFSSVSLKQEIEVFYKHFEEFNVLINFGIIMKIHDFVDFQLAKSNWSSSYPQTQVYDISLDFTIILKK